MVLRQALLPPTTLEPRSAPHFIPSLPSCLLPLSCPSRPFPHSFPSYPFPLTSLPRAPSGAYSQPLDDWNRWWNPTGGEGMEGWVVEEGRGDNGSSMSRVMRDKRADAIGSTVGWRKRTVSTGGARRMMLREREG